MAREQAADEVARLRVALSRISRLLERQVTGGMTRTQMGVLGTVAVHGPIGASQLAEREGINPTMLSRILSKLEESGLLRRATADADRRAVLVELTPEGRRLHKRLRAERSSLLAENLRSLGPDQTAEILAAVPALEALVELVSREPVRA